MYNKMSEGYFCELCGYVTTNKQTYTRHLARKTPCNAVKSNFKTNTPEINENTSEHNGNTAKHNGNTPKHTEITPEINEDTSSLESLESLDKERQTRTCSICNKVFKNPHTMHSHKNRKACSSIPKHNPKQCKKCLKIFSSSNSRAGHEKRNTCNSTVAILPKETPPPSQTSVQITGDHNTNNVNIVVVNNYGNEQIDYISKNVVALAKAIHAGPKGLQHMIEHIYFNKEHPENRTVQIPNVAKEICQTWNAKSEDWKYKPLDKVSYDMMYKAAFPLYTHYNSQNKRDRNFEKITKAIQSSENRPEEKRLKSTPEDRKVYRKLVKDTRCTLMNNRDMEF